MCVCVFIISNKYNRYKLTLDGKKEQKNVRVDDLLILTLIIIVRTSNSHYAPYDICVGYIQLKCTNVALKQMLFRF